MKPRNYKERAKLVREMSNELKNQYDCILKIDAIKWLKQLHPESSLTLIINAYMLAYED